MSLPLACGGAKSLFAHYEAQAEDESVAEDEAGVEPSETVMRVPHDLVRIVREPIAKRRGQ